MQLYQLPAIAKIALATTAALTILAPLSAFAGDAVASGGPSLHTGPGLSYPTTGKLTNGVSYPVQECLSDTSWCLVDDKQGTAGWVDASYLVGSAAKSEAKQYGLTRQDFWNPSNY